LWNVGITQWFQKDRIFPEEGEVFSATLRAVRYANQLATKNEIRVIEDGPHGIQPKFAEEAEPVYYLV
jgi:hypothetical protein